MKYRWLWLGLVVLLSSSPVQADLASRITPLIVAHRGRVTVAIKHLETGESFQHDADRVMPTASLIKFPVMVEAYRQRQAGRIDLDELVTLRQEDQVPGSGILTTHFSPGMQLSLRDAVRLMIVFSDNTATNLVLDKIGLTATAQAMEELGLPETKIHAKVFRGDTSVFPERSRAYGLGSTTANETVRLYELLHAKKLVSEEACTAMLEHLLHCDDQVKLAALLPEGTKIAHKGGAVSNKRCDAGIIFSPRGPFAICVLTAENKDLSWADDNEAHLLCARIGREAYDHFNPRDASDPSAPTDLRKGAQGELVEALQRTLNQRLQPSPNLDVDGDFGGQTEAAVKRLQREHHLDVTGVVSGGTWETLGPLLMQDAPVADPQVVNAESITKSAADALQGAPFVTCKAWAISDAGSGELLWSENAEQGLDFASTTKIMTAYVVLRKAAEEPALFDAEVTFSRRADETRGSTAGIRAGERLNVRELLYGLLLPSGNDAAVALAEHLGPRFDAVEAGDSPDDPLPRFVAEMNRTAEALDMSATTYKNPHGLTEAGHVSTAADLLKLARAAMQLESFREYVSTPQRGCTVRGAEGYRRNMLWKNTNQLLSIDGYLGVKTGTTDAAGACLISCGRRGDDELLMVVLGSQSGAARYTDTRNLFRWAWQQRGHQDQPAPTVRSGRQTD